MENKSHAFWAGLFALGLLAAVIAAAFWFDTDRTVRVPYDLVARASVTGLAADAPVRYRGLDVGKVQSIAFDPAHPGDIRIRILVDKEAPITHSTYGSLGFQGVTGIAFVQLDDSGADTHALASSLARVAEIPMHPSMFDQLQTSGQQLLSQLQQAAASVNKMLSGDTHEQLDAAATSVRQAADGIATLTKQLGPAATRLPATLDRANQAFVSFDALVAPNGALQGNLARAGAAAEQASKTLVDVQRSIDDLSARVGDDTLPRLNRLASHVSDASRSVGAAADAVSANPRGLLFGMPAGGTPGPGETGFNWPQAGGRQ